MEKGALKIISIIFVVRITVENNDNHNNVYVKVYFEMLLYLTV